MKVSTEQAASEEGRIHVRVGFAENDLDVRRTPFGLVVTLADCEANAGRPGAPALPRATIHVALPEGSWPIGFDLGEAHTIRLTDEPELVLPIQPARPGVHEGPPGGHGSAEHGHDEGGDGDVAAAAPPPTREPVPPDADEYDRAARDATIARPTGLRSIGLWNVVTIELRPVRMTEEGLLEFTTEFAFVVRYGARPEPSDAGPDVAIERLRARGISDIDPRRVAPMPESTIGSGAQLRRLGEMLRDLVVNPDVIRPSWEKLRPLNLPADYLVITDNQGWDANAIAPTGPLDGDVVASFSRLAAWKRGRGVSATVVTISDIVAGRFGDFRTGSRDLPEVIRRFLKWAHTHWGVAWLLLGGDIGIVPTRLAAGAVEGHVKTTTNDPPGDNLAHWSGSFLKMHVVELGALWPGSWTPILVNPATGQLIPFDTTGATAGGGLGWYYTTSDTYATRSTIATNFVRVNGPAWLLDRELQFLYEWNRIPTDFYYASLASWVVASEDVGIGPVSFEVPYVYFPAHDWDALDNGLYGQYANGDVDGVLWQTDLSVGRAPVRSLAEADAFVDKVIAYEHFRAPDGTPLDADWPRRLVLAASNWDKTVSIAKTLSDPPDDDRFHAGPASTLIKLKDWPADFSRQLIAEISDSDRRELPFTGGGTARGWYYATSASDSSPATLSASFGWGSFTSPWVSQWIVVHGAAAELDPRSYLLAATGQDGSMSDQEKVRAQLAAEVPGWDQVSRFYEDETDLTAAQAAAAPVAHLTSTRIRDAMEAGPHIVSLSGHGNGGGCCSADTWIASALTNGWHSFIGYADSCLTNQFDAPEAFSEALLRNGSGGAVAYVGNTRFSWIGEGDDLQRAFFHRLASTRHLGLLNDTRVRAVDLRNDGVGRWVAFALNLMGDPEMPVWRRRGWRLLVEIDRTVRLDVPFRVRVRRPRPGEPNGDVVVHVRQGDREWLATPDVDGIASFDLGGAEIGPFTLTVSAPDAIPTVEELTIAGPVWLWGRVGAVRHRDGGGNHTIVVLETADGAITVRADGAGPDYGLIVDALTDAFTTRSVIGLLVDRVGDGARIDQFRFDQHWFDADHPRNAEVDPGD